MTRFLFDLFVALFLSGGAGAPDDGAGCPLPPGARVLCCEQDESGCRTCVELPDGTVQCFLCTPSGCKVIRVCAPEECAPRSCVPQPCTTPCPAPDRAATAGGAV